MKTIKPIIKSSRRKISKSIINTVYAATMKNLKDWNCDESVSKTMAFAMAKLHYSKLKLGDTFTIKEKADFFRIGYNRALEYYAKNIRHRNAN